MAKRRRGISEETLLLLALLLIGLSSLAAAMVFSVVVTVAVVGKPVRSVLEVATEPTSTAMATPVSDGETPTVMPTTPTPTTTPTAAATVTPTATRGTGIPTPTFTTPPPTPADITPPGQVMALVAGPGGGSGEIQLIWDARPEQEGVARYNVYRATALDGDFALVAIVKDDQVAWLPDGTREFIDFPVSGAFWYVVSAEDLAGNEGAESVKRCGAPVGDSCFVVD